MVKDGLGYAVLSNGPLLKCGGEVSANVCDEFHFCKRAGLL
jgi:hypothetical protein